MRLHKFYEMGGITFSPDGRYVATRGECLHLWDMTTGRLVRTLCGDDTEEIAPFYSFAFTPDGKTIVSAAVLGEPVRFWDVATGHQWGRVPGPGPKENQAPLSALTMSPDGNHFACSGGEALYLGGATGGRPLLEVAEVGEREVKALAFTHDAGAVAILDSGGDVSLLQLATGKVVQRFETGPAEPVLAPDGRRVAGVADEEVVVWDVPTGRKTPLCKAEWKKTWYRLSFSPDAKTLVAHELCSGTVALWDLDALKPLRRIDLPLTELIQDVFLSPDGRTLAGHDERRSVLRLWDAADGRPRVDFPGHLYPPGSLSWSADGRTLASGRGDVLLWDVAGQQTRATAFIRDESRNMPLALQFSPGCDWAAWADGNTLNLFDVRHDKLAHELQGCGFHITTFSFSPCGGLLATAGELGTTRIWDVRAGKLLRLLDTRTHSDRVSWVAFTPDGAALVTGDGPYRVHLWETDTGRHLATVEGAREEGKDHRPDERWQCRMAPDGRTVCASSCRDVAVWDLADRKEAERFQGDEADVWIEGPPLCVSPDARLLARFDDCDSLRLVEKASGEVVYAFPRGCSDVAFAADGRRLATGCWEDGSILIWDLWELLGAVERRGEGGTERAWADLASTDAAHAYRTIVQLARDKRSAVDLLGQRLRPVTDAKTHEAAAWLAQLGSPEFEVRSRATQRLGELREAALPFLERAREGRPPLEVWRRLEGLRGALDERSAESLREVRAVQVLEYIGTDEARRQLHRLAGGLPQARLTREAQGALGRLNRRPPP
jgi:WD40 repeat protein